MMISPEGYYEYFLKGKSPAQIMRCIRSLKREMNRLRNIVDHPDYPYRTDAIDPSESVQLIMSREYLETAKQALVEAGGTYIPTKAEQRIAAFDKSVPFISKIIYTSGGFCSGYSRKTFIFGESKLLMKTEDLLSDEEPVEVDISLYREEMLGELAELHLGEWRRHYNLLRYGMAVLDGVQWELKIHFSNGHRMVKISGNNAYPYAFRDLADVLGLSFADDCE